MPQEIQHIPGVGEVQTTTVPTPVVEDQQSDAKTTEGAIPDAIFKVGPAGQVEHRVVHGPIEKR